MTYTGIPVLWLSDTSRRIQGYLCFGLALQWSKSPTRLLADFIVQTTFTQSRAVLKCDESAIILSKSCFIDVISCVPD